MEGMMGDLFSGPSIDPKMKTILALLTVHIFATGLLNVHG
jgi:hypothetical protein